MNDNLEVERQLLSILLANKDAAKDWSNGPIGSPKYFDPVHQNLVEGVIHASLSDVRLTRNTFKDFLATKKKLTPQESAAQISLFNQANLEAGKPDDFPMLTSRVKAAFIRRKTAQFIGDWRKDSDKLGDLVANANLIQKLQGLEADASDSKAVAVDLAEAKGAFMDGVYQRRNNPLARLTCGIKEIDETMSVGFKVGHLTMFCADVGSFKTTMMVNVALNLFLSSGENILYIPLEMPADEITQKIVARQTGIALHLIEHAQQLTDAQIKILADEFDKWIAFSNRFKILEMGGRAKLSQVKREIEKLIMTGFQPRMVFIDYADNLVPERNYNRSDLEMNDILEDMRQMGRTLGFGVVSAAQLARDALKRTNEQKETNKQSLGSTDIRGGQVIAANSDTVYGQLRNPSQPGSELLFFCIKSRHGKNTFGFGSETSSRAILTVRPEIGLITSPTEATMSPAEFENPAGAEVLDGIFQPPSFGGADEDPDSPF